jgi:hypothetical protein
MLQSLPSCLANSLSVLGEQERKTFKKGKLAKKLACLRKGVYRVTNCDDAGDKEYAFCFPWKNASDAAFQATRTRPAASVSSVTGMLKSDATGPIRKSMLVFANMAL